MADIATTVDSNFIVSTWARKRLRLNSAQADLASDSWHALASCSTRCVHLQRVQIEYGQDHIGILVALHDEPVHLAELSLCDVYAVAMHVAAALFHLHSFRSPQIEVDGIAHADVRPHNIFQVRDGSTIRYCLGGFESARMLVAGFDGWGQPLPRLSPPLSKESLGYRSPEQWLGHPPTHSSDVWSLGISLLELLFGRPMGIAPSDQLRMRLSQGGSGEQVAIEMREKVTRALQTVKSNLGPIAEPLLSVINGCLQTGPARMTSGQVAQELQKAHTVLTQRGQLHSEAFLGPLPEIKPVKEQPRSPPQAGLRSPSQPRRSPYKPRFGPLRPSDAIDSFRVRARSANALIFQPGLPPTRGAAFDFSQLLRDVDEFLPEHQSRYTAPGLSELARKAALADPSAMYEGWLADKRK